MVNIAQIGCGYWGPNLLRSFSSVNNCHLKYLVDPSKERRAFVEKNFPGITATSDLDKVLRDSDVNSLVIATPAGSHYELAQAGLIAGKNVFVEKPLATTVAEVDKLGRLGKERGLIVMAGHTFLFNPAVRYVKKMIERRELGDLRYIYCQRLNLGRIRSDIDAMWNLAPHDISIIQYWLNNQQPLQVMRKGMDYIQPGVEDVVFLNLVYPNKIMAHVHVSWLDPQKTRKIIIVGSKRMVIYDDVADDKIAIYDKGIDQKAVLGVGMHFDTPPVQFSYRSGDVLMPRIDWVEPLRAEAQHFVDCVRDGNEPLTGVSHARHVVEILERCRPDSSMK